MPPSPPPPQQHPPTTAYLKATYTSPGTPTPQPLSSTALTLPPTPHTVAAKTAYLAALRAATTALQDQINADLTARMEQDAVAAAAAGAGTGAATKTQGGVGVIDEANEEENYGEEVPEDDDDLPA